MFDRTKRILSHDCGFWTQFIKYGVIGLLSTGVQLVVFYFLASTCLKCLQADDWAVRWFGLPAVEQSDAMRTFLFVVATVLGFFVSNVFCWLMNRAFVFRGGKYVWYKEFLFFIGVSGFSMGLGLAISALLISLWSVMTSLAVVVEVGTSFCFNYLMRKYFIFKG